MKKALSLLSAALIAGTGMASAETQSMEWGYSDGVKTAYQLEGMSVGKVLYLGVKIPQSEAKLLAGAKITKITVYGGASSSNKNLIKKVFPFVTPNLSATEYPVQGEMTMSETALGANEYTLETPFEISGKEDLYVGYYFGISKDLLSAFYVPTDKTPTTAETCLQGVSSKLSQRPSQFQNLAGQVGSLALSITVEGEKLPQEFVSINKCTFPINIRPGVECTTSVTIKNRGYADVNNITVTKQYGTETSAEDYKLDTPLKTGETCRLRVKGTLNDENQISLVKMIITKVNGNANLCPDNVAMTSVNTTDKTQGFERRYLIEDATATWCGYCPRGISTLEYIKEKYPDNFSCIGVHTGDPMEVESYGGFLMDYIEGLPTLLLDRSKVLNTGSYEQAKSTVDQLVTDLETTKTYGKTDLKGYVDKTKTWLRIEATTTLNVPSTAPHTLSFVLVEDGFGPYNQTNYYSGGSKGSFDGWENKAASVSMMYDDVARDLVGYPGIVGCMPDVTEADKEYTVTQDIPLTNVRNLDKAYVFAILLNAVTGDVVNTTKVAEFTESDFVGSVEELDGEETVAFRVENGSIVAGTSAVEVYTLDGRRVANSNLATGLYVATANGKVAKILVK